jgi:hypothetical protein
MAEPKIDELKPEHIAALRASAISDEVIEARGYQTITKIEELAILGFAPVQRNVPGLLIPLWTTDCEQLPVYRPDNPRVVENKNKLNPDGTHPNKIIKYEFPKGARMRLDCPPMVRAQLGNPSVPLWITEGQKKADSLVSAGLCAVALLGVWNWRGTNDVGGKVLLPDWNSIALNGREVHIVFDSDVMQKLEVQKALKALIAMLSNKHASVTVVYLPSEPGRGKVGVDDWLYAGHTLAELESLVEAPRLALVPPSDTVRLLDDTPLAISRPLSLVNGRAYAVTWLPVEITKTHTIDKKGNITRHDPPIVSNEKRMFAVREDGAIFGDGGGAPLEKLGLEIKLPEEIPAGKEWSTRGVKAYNAGERPTPADVFERVRSVVDTFIDFDHSLADQRTMTEFIACYILHTYFLDAFNVTGFLWPNGEKGSGKTQLLVVIAEMAYLGKVVLSGGSFASLRDLADYGATIAFDDAEGMADSKKTDPDKRALLLAGNRRGATVPLKEPRPDGTWKTRYVNAYCPRLFSATQLPDPILSSRTIIVPLIRTPDPKRGNAEPLDYQLWPCDKRNLIDDLWALALGNLSLLPEFEKVTTEESDLVGRNLDPWRAVLAIAGWLDKVGVDGLWKRMKSLSLAYQKERPELEVSDITGLTIRALCACVVKDIKTINPMKDINSLTPHFFDLSTSSIAEKAKELAEAEELDFNLEYITPRRIGRVLGKMRFPKSRKPGTRARQWRVEIKDLERWTKSYGLDMPAEIKLQKGLPINVLDGLNGLNGTNGVGYYKNESHVDIPLSQVTTEPPLEQPVTFSEDSARLNPVVHSFPDISKPCYACHEIAWRERPAKSGGGYYCSSCYPGG